LENTNFSGDRLLPLAFTLPVPKLRGAMLNLSSLNAQQRQAVETIRGPVLILAGAGTGKTRVITYRIAHLIERGVEPANILGVTFTNKAAREMQERVVKLIPRRRVEGNGDNSAKPNRPTLCTFHSLCVRILRQHIELLGYKRNFVIYDESDQLSAVKKILARISARGNKIDPSSVLHHLSLLRTSAGDVGTNQKENDDLALAQHIRRNYETALRACNAVDFDDLILLTLRLFDEHSAPLDACRARYRYVMVDEYQDTNAAQFKLVHSLTREHRNLCVVGDDDQSIYGWRGADISNLLDMEKHFPEVKVVKLEQNYRSTNTILKAANALITKNPRRRGKQLWSQKGDGVKILLHAFKDEEEEARTIVERINHERHARRARWGDHAILFRTNMQARPLETALRAANVRYHLIGGQSYFDRREVRDFLAYLKTFVNPHDDVSLLRIANVPARGLSDVTMERLLGASQERKCSVFAAMKNPAVIITHQSAARASIERFVGFIERARAQLHTEHAAPDPRGLQKWADHFLDEIGYINELRRSEKTPEAAENRIRNVKELTLSLDGPTSTARPMDRLEQFLDEVSLDTEREEEDEGPEDAVTLITMHSCKGLEFPHVYVVGMEQGLLPHTRSSETGLEEERRLFYVAITRAMQTLNISHCGSRNKYGQAVPCHPSQFIKELPEELVESADEKGKQLVAVGSAKSYFDAARAALE
jgi:DNA helicase II / ATP-dependent DNA helicase PcrA